ncbi:MAG: hypothetical protein WBF04_10250 [Candidatus Sulfotelmatobacter sp.]
MSLSTRIVLLLATAACFSNLALGQEAAPETPATNPSAQNLPVSSSPAQDAQGPMPPVEQQSAPVTNSAPSAAQPAPQSAAPQSDSSSKPAPTGQDAAPAASPQAPSDKDKDKDKAAQTANGKGRNAGTSNDRLFLALPNFLTLEGSDKVAPLTTGQKFKVVARGAFDKVQIPWYLSLAAISQAENSEPGYGQGWEGYGKRFASAFADGAIENFMTSAVFPSMLRQDPRFFQSSQGGFAHRTGYAISRIFVTRTDSGHSQFNYSEILGSALAAAICTNTYHPRAFISKHYDSATNTVTYIHNTSDRTLPNTLSVWGTQMGYDSITYVVKEFWPDIRRKMAKKHNAPAAAQPASANPSPPTGP